MSKFVFFCINNEEAFIRFTNAEDLSEAHQKGRNERRIRHADFKRTLNEEQWKEFRHSINKGIREAKELEE